MEENIQILKEKFQEIKNKDLHKSLRRGSTGIGYTFEYLLGKKEDNASSPDFNGIEIKTQLGYTKKAFTLFCLSPSNKNAIKYIFEHYSYPGKNNNFKVFRGQAYYKLNYLSTRQYIFKLKINYSLERIELVVINRYLELVDNSIYWTFAQIKERLYTKLNYLAYIKGYPYTKKEEIYYKYTSMHIYKLKSFEHFLKLIEKDLIYVAFNISCQQNEDYLNDRGTAFKLEHDHIEELFDLID